MMPKEKPLVILRGRDKQNMCTVVAIIYDAKHFSCKLTTCNMPKSQLVDVILNNQAFPVNFKVTRDGRIYNRDMYSGNSKRAHALIINTAKIVRSFMEKEYGTDTDLCGNCIEASETIVAILRYYGYFKCKTVEGWCQYDDDSSCTDRDYDEHTWVECENGKIYVDVTADQFNLCMFKENQYSGVIIRAGLPHGMSYDRPISDWDEED